MFDNAFSFIMDCSIDDDGNILAYEAGQPLNGSDLGGINDTECNGMKIDNAFSKAFPGKIRFISTMEAYNVNSENGSILIAGITNPDFYVGDSALQEMMKDYTFKCTKNNYEEKMLGNKVHQRLYLPQSVSPEHFFIDTSLNREKQIDEIIEYFKGKGISKIVLKNPSGVLGKGNIFIESLEDRETLTTSLETLITNMRNQRYIIAEEQKIYKKRRIDKNTGKEKEGFITYRIVGIATKGGILGYFIVNKYYSKSINSQLGYLDKCYFGERYRFKNLEYVGPKDKYFGIGPKAIKIDKLQLEETFKNLYAMNEDIQSSTKNEFEAHVDTLVKRHNIGEYFDPRMKQEQKSLSYAELQLERAIKEDYYYVAKHIYQTYSDENYSNGSIASLLKSAKDKKDSKFFRRLLVKYIDKIDDDSMIISAAILHDEESLRLLLNHEKHRANINAVNEYGGWIALHYTLRYDYCDDNVSVIQLLLASGADVNARAKFCGMSFTPLSRAVQCNYVNAIKLLLEYNADVNAKDGYGDTPLHIAIQSGNSKIVKLLLEHDADTTIRNKDDKTPLDLAREKSNTVIINLLEKVQETTMMSGDPPQNPQAKPNAKKVRNISDIFQISKAHYSFESYASGRGVTELSAEEICKMNQYAKDIKKDSEELDKFIKKIEEVRMMLTMALDNLDLEKYVSEGKIEVLEKYLDVARQHFEITADILGKDKLEGEDLVAKKRERIKKILNDNAQSQNGPETNGDAESEAQDESKQLQQRAQSAYNILNQEIKKNESNPQTTTNKPQGESNVYDNKGFGKEIMSVVGAIAGAIAGAIIGATIAYLAGATLPIIAVIAVISAVPGVLIGCGIAEICEKVSGERKNDPEKGILTALSIVLTPKCMSGGDVAKT